MTRCTCTWGTHVTTSYPVGVSAYGITATDPACPHHGSDPKEPTVRSTAATRRPSYRAAVEWIAREDEPSYTDAAEVMVESGVAIGLVADLWGKLDEDVANDVARWRRRAGVQVD